MSSVPGRDWSMYHAVIGSGPEKPAMSIPSSFPKPCAAVSALCSPETMLLKKSEKGIVWARTSGVGSIRVRFIVMGMVKVTGWVNLRRECPGSESTRRHGPKFQARVSAGLRTALSARGRTRLAQ